MRAGLRSCALRETRQRKKVSDAACTQPTIEAHRGTRWMRFGCVRAMAPDHCPISFTSCTCAHATGPAQHLQMYLKAAPADHAIRMLAPEPLCFTPHRAQCSGLHVTACI